MQELLRLYVLLIVTSADPDPVAADLERTVKWSKGTCDLIKEVCHLCFIPLFILFVHFAYGDMATSLFIGNNNRDDSFDGGDPDLFKHAAFSQEIVEGSAEAGIYIGWLGIFDHGWLSLLQ